jgi:hypothetical protein
MDRPARSRSLAGPIIVLVGGAVTIVGSLLNWGSVSLSAPQLGSPKFSGTGASATEGKIAIVAGIAMVIGGLLMWLSPNRALRRGMAIVAIVGGLAIAGLTTYDIATKDTQFRDAIREEVRSFPAGANLSDAQIDAAVKQLGAKISLEFGIILTLIGGAIGLVGGVVALAAKEPEAATAGLEAPAVPPPPAAATPPPPPTEPDA